MYKDTLHWFIAFFTVVVASLGMWAEHKAQDVAEVRTQGGEMLLILAVGWQASAVRCEKVGHFCKVAGMSIVSVDGPHFTVDTLDCA